MEESIGGVILYDETIRQSADDGTPFPDVLASKGVPGIKVDTGAHDLAGFPGEKVTEGLDGLRPGSRSTGARRALREVAGRDHDRRRHPLGHVHRANAHALARYAAFCQEADLVPIVEPEVLMDGDNTIETCDDVTGRTLRATYAALYEHDVHLRGTLLKPNMVIAGKGCPTQASSSEIASLTVHNLKRHVPLCARHRLPLRRPVRSGGDREPERDQPDRRPVAALVLLREGPPGLGAEGVGRRRRERGGCAGGLRASRAHERARGGR